MEKQIETRKNNRKTQDGKSGIQKNFTKNLFNKSIHKTGHKYMTAPSLNIP
jgi:hypothetical protein